MISDAELAAMRTTQETAMPGTVVIERSTLSSDGMGGYSESWAAIGTVIGRVYPKTRSGQSEFVTGGQVVSEMQWHATLPVGTNVIARDRLLYASRTWEVTSVNNDEMWQTAVRCEVEAHNEERRA